MGQPVEVRVLSRAMVASIPWRLVSELLQQNAQDTKNAALQFESGRATYPRLFFLPPTELSLTGKVFFVRQG
jgi:hypothetical protein